jgi:predicted homoserine dehydrogenase-like protein
VAIAKRDLKPGEVLDGIGGFTCYTLIENYDASRRERALPMGISEGCVLTRAVPKDRAVTYDDVELPANRLCDRLRREQEEMHANTPRLKPSPNFEPRATAGASI